MYVIGLAASLGPALSLAWTGLWALWKGSKVPPNTLLSEAVLTLGFAVVFNLLFPWFRFGYSARWATAVLMVIVSITRIVASVRRSSGIKDVLSFTPSPARSWMVRTKAWLSFTSYSLPLTV